MSDKATSISDQDFKYITIGIIVIVAIFLILYFSPSSNNTTITQSALLQPIQPELPQPTLLQQTQPEIILSEEKQTTNKLLQNINTLLSIGSTSKDINNDFERNNGAFSPFVKNYIDTNKPEICNSIMNHKNNLTENRDKLVNLLNKEIIDCDVALSRVNCF